MRKPLRVLFVEDNEQDLELLLRELRRGGYEPEHERVETAEALRAALQKGPSLVFSDWSMPQFEAPMALAVVKELAPDVPFIIVSGTVDEEAAVEAMRAGANDFISKDRLARFLPAVARELRDAALRKERRKLEEQLMVSDRMASMGTLAAGVAHEINNPLAAVMANLDFIAEDMVRLIDDIRRQPTDSWREWLTTRLGEMAEPLQDARESSDRVKHIVRDLKIFSRSNEERHGPVDVKRVLESSVRMAWNEIRHRARLVKEYADVPPVLCNENRLGQLFLNLIVNAAQAIPEGHAERNELRIRTSVADEQRVAIEFCDTGSGIAPEHLSRIFDAFFTTKPHGVGTGLGLAICHSIVTSFGGEIDVESRVGSGTTFRVLLPVAAQPEEAVAAAGPGPLPTRRGRVLVIDDEAMVCASIRRMLMSEHEVVTVCRGQEALDFFNAGQRFDVVLCDLMMPHMTGMEIYEGVSRVAPEMTPRLVFMTGGAFTSNARLFLDGVPNARLEKPFDAGSLRSVVRSLVQ